MTDNFAKSVIVRRPYLKAEWIEYVLKNSMRMEVQSNGRIRHWAYIAQVAKYLRMVTESDG